MPSKRWTAWLLVFVFLSHIPFSQNQLKTDDFLQHAMLAGNAQLAELGFPTQENKTLAARVADGFHFFNSDYNSIAPQRDFGNLPWWSVEEGKMHPFRPLASLTHWLDYEIFSSNLWIIQIHSLLYFMMLAVALLYCYRLFSNDSAVVLLASALLLFDLSMAGNWSWIAARNAYLGLALGVISLWAYHQWRSRDVIGYGALALLFFVFALLSAEASLALLGYFGAYAITIDKKGKLKGCLAVLPFFLLMLVWRWYYTQMGYGASGVGLYIDPGHNVSDFFTQLLSAYPLISVSLITGFDSLLSPFSPPARVYLIAASWVICLACLWLVRPIWRQSLQVRFMLLGSLLAVVPYISSYNPSFRSSTFIALGFFYVISVWLLTLIRQRQSRLKKMIGYGLIVFWLGLPALATLANSWKLLPITFIDTGLYANASAVLQSEKKPSLLVVNFGSPSQLYYVPYEWSFRYGVLPARIQTLTPGLSTIQVTRTDEYTLLVESPQGLVLNQDAVMIPIQKTEEAPFNPRYKYRVSEGLYTSPDQMWRAGQIIESAGMSVKLLAVRGNQPTKLQVTFTDQEPLEQKLWQWFDWSSLQFKTMAPLALGETRSFAGPLKN